MHTAILFLLSGLLVGSAQANEAVDCFATNKLPKTATQDAIKYSGVSANGHFDGIADKKQLLAWLQEQVPQQFFGITKELAEVHGAFFANPTIDRAKQVIRLNTALAIQLQEFERNLQELLAKDDTAPVLKSFIQGYVNGLRDFSKKQRGKQSCKLNNMP
jgi:hypothetical protein